MHDARSKIHLAWRDFSKTRLPTLQIQPLHGKEKLTKDLEADERLPVMRFRGLKTYLRRHPEASKGAHLTHGEALFVADAINLMRLMDGKAVFLETNFRAAIQKNSSSERDGGFHTGPDGRSRGGRLCEVAALGAEAVAAARAHDRLWAQCQLRAP